MAGSAKAILLQHGLRAKHAFGQNFLTDATLAERIADAATSLRPHRIIEIGAGLGALTKPLLERTAHVVAIERDRDLVPILRATYLPWIESGKLTVLEQDAVTADWESWLNEPPTPNAVAGNLPYHLTGPLLRRTVSLADAISQAVYLVQLEVAERLLAQAGTPHYGALTVFVRSSFDVERVLTIRRGAFYPPPKVDSAVVRLTPLRPPLTEETPIFVALVHAAFQQRRKKLRNAWGRVGIVEQGALVCAAEELGIDLDARGETLSPERFAALSKTLEET